MAPADPIQLASSVRKDARLGNGPLDIFAFLNERQDLVLIRRFGDGANIDGIYVKGEGSGTGFIYINRAKPLGRQHFTAAHELGHHVLGHHDEFDADVFAEGQRSEERAANQFAAELLVPRRGLTKFVSQQRLDVSRLADAIQVARHFGVTLAPVLIQLRSIDRLSGLDQGRLMREFDALRPNPLAEWESVSSSDKTELPPRFVEHVKRQYLTGEITLDAAAEALDTSIEVVVDRFGRSPAVVAPSDLSDLL